MIRLFLFWLVAPVWAFGQGENVLLSRRLVKFSPQHVGANTLLAGFEQFNSTYTRSICLDFGIRHLGNYTLPEDDIERGFEVNVQYRSYLKGMVNVSNKRGNFSRGVYIGPFLQAGQTNVRDLVGSRSTFNVDPNLNTTKYEYNRYEARFLGAGFTVGLQHTLWRVVTLDAGIGGGIRWTDTRFLEQSSSWMNVDVLVPAFEGIFPRIGLKLGIML